MKGFNVAEIVKMDVGQKSGRPQVYSWEEWFKASLADPSIAVVLKHGEDFDVAIDMFRNTIYGAANRYGLKAKTTINYTDNTIAFSVRKKES
jgi:hypothetical protein